jgi:hypothetical protein
MNEQQRREQIAKMRQQQMQQRQQAPAMSDADAIKIAADQGTITQEQVVMAAMLGKMINGGLNDLRKQSVGEGLKIGSVDMSKVMPSGIAAAAGMRNDMPPTLPAFPPSVVIPPAEVPITAPEELPILELPVTQIPSHIGHHNITAHSQAGQLELEFEKKARYDDIYKKLSEIEDRMVVLHEKANKILDLLDKKKLKRAQTDGTQTG